MTPSPPSNPSCDPPTPSRLAELVQQVLTAFVPRFAPSARPIYVAAVGEGSRVYDEAAFARLGVPGPWPTGMPDIVLHEPLRGWLFVIDITEPIDARRARDLVALLDGCTPGLVLVTACADRSTFAGYAARIAWGTHVWTADDPGHMIHFGPGQLSEPSGPPARLRAVR